MSCEHATFRMPGQHTTCAATQRINKYSFLKLAACCTLLTSLGDYSCLLYAAPAEAQLILFKNNGIIIVIHTKNTDNYRVILSVLIYLEITILKICFLNMSSSIVYYSPNHNFRLKLFIKKTIMCADIRAYMAHNNSRQEIK